MVTMETLRAYSDGVNAGLARCMNNEAFYLRMVGMVSADTHIAQAAEAVERGDLKAAFEAAHALKGVLANLGLDPALKPVSELTEIFRARSGEDCSALLREAQQEMDRLQQMLKG